LNKEELLAYTYNYLSYLFRSKTTLINQVILFGSVARGDFDENSDVDIFIDVDSKNEKEMNKIAERALNKFYQLEQEKWQLKGIKNKINLKIGFLEEWNLKDSLEREGIVLYSSATSPKLKKYFLFLLEPVKPIKKRIRVMRKLVGRKEKGYKDVGIISKCGGRVLNTRTFVVPVNGFKEVSSLLAKEKVIYQFEEIWE